MNFIKNTFGKDITKLTYSDFEIFFSTNQVENDFSEFKSFNENQSFDKNLENIHRTLCGLLNSAGGFIIWGAPGGVSVPDQPEKVFTGDLKPINQVIGKDRMVNKLADKITPLPTSFKVEIIPNNNNDKAICVIEVEKSNYSPHQVSNTYYMRIDGQTRPAPHHYIEALFKQIKYPDVQAFLYFNKVKVDKLDTIFELTIYVCNFSPLQNETDVAVSIFVKPGHLFSDKVDIHEVYVGDTLMTYRFSDVLSYGLPLLKKHKFRYSLDEFERSKGKLEVILSVVGKNSPAKVSKYNWTHNGSYNPDSPSDHLGVIYENLLYSEIDEPFDATKEDFLRVVLKRKL